MRARGLALRRTLAAASCAASLALALASPAQAQLALSNLLGGQLGNIPFTDPRNRTDFYDGLDLDYRSQSLRLGLSYETDRNSENLYTYSTITRRYAEWDDQDLRVRVGNFYTLLGRGLIQRAFDVPGVVLDQPGLRSRYALSRDVDGVLAEASVGPVDARLFSGSPNGGEFSPAAEAVGFTRYQGQESGGQLTARLYRSASLGAAFLRYTGDGVQQREFGSGFAEVDPLEVAGVRGASLPLYFEYAQGGKSASRWWRFSTSERDTQALYAGGNLLWGPLTLSGEWKDYANFRLGINDPPSLVREQSAPLLNRNTHVLDADRERGFQLESSVAVTEWGSVTANMSRSDGRFVARAVRYDELFLELHAGSPHSQHWEVTIFHDQGKDQFVFIPARRLWGGIGTWRLPQLLSVALDLEQQIATRGPDRFVDHYASVTLTRAAWGSAAWVWERTDDPAEEDPAFFSDARVHPRSFLSGVIDARLSDHHEATLMIGERRGGLACTAGTCYQVLPFKGAELRLTTRF